jgi:hypothetical protein
MAILEPIWKTKTETAVRLRGRLETILDWATVRGYRAGLNPARWKGHLSVMLPAPGKVANAGHHRALPYARCRSSWHGCAALKVKARRRCSSQS